MPGTIHEQYRRMIAADAAFGAELRRVYGRSAQERRYQTAPHADSAINVAIATFRRETDAYLAMVRAARRHGDPA